MWQRSLLADADVELLGDGVLTLLERVGILCQNDDILEALEGQGARVDRARQTVTFPRRMVEGFVEALRQETQDRGKGCHGGPRMPPLPHVGGQVAQFFYDYDVKEKRPGNREDFISLVKLGDVLHPETAVSHPLLLTEVPPLLEPLEAAMLLAEYAHTPGPAFAWNVRQVDYLLEMGDILGIPDWFSWGAICFAHPLRFDRDVADKFVRRVRSGYPTGLSGMPVSGVTAPVTVAGFIVVSGAEFIVTWLAARALNPHVPLVGGIWGGTVDMRTGWVSYCSPDAMLRACASSEFLRRWCGQVVPLGGGEYCDARLPGLYAALEKAYKAMTIAAFTGRHPAIGQGMLEEGKTVSPVQLLLERELGIGVEFLGRSIEVTPETIALDTILGVGIGLEKSYLEVEHTARNFRRCLWCPELLDRSGWNGFEDEKSLLDRIQGKVRELIASYQKPEGDPEKLDAMRHVVERAQRDLLR